VNIMDMQKKTIKGQAGEQEMHFNAPRRLPGPGTSCGVGRRGCGRECAAVGSTDEKDEICVRKN